MRETTIRGQRVSSIVQGCMRISALSAKELEALVRHDLELGINFFDHADIYGKGTCEAFFGNLLKQQPALREQMFIQSKCGIHQGVTTHYDFSKEYILSCVDQSLERLQCGYLDYLLLHRPDALMEPKEVAAAFDALYSSGKVRHFGVSNHNPYQIELLKTAIHQPLEINQMQMSVAHTPMIDAGINVNTFDDHGIDRGSMTLDYCRLHDMTLQCWSPFLYGMFEGNFLDSPLYPALNERLQEIADVYGTTKAGIAIAWLLRHPAHMQVVLGSCNQAHIDDIVKASGITLTREEWYSIYTSAGNPMP